MRSILFLVLGYTLEMIVLFGIALPTVVGFNSNTPLSPIISKLSPNPKPGLPKRLIIPSISVDTPIEQVGLDNEGRMGIPVDVYDAGWYAYGFRPGDHGNAVIDGHVDDPKLRPNIFTNLDMLIPGDRIIIQDSRNRQWNFSVDEVTQEDSRPGFFPLQKIFGPSANPQLNLITCGGFFERSLDDFSKRTVVYSTLVNVS